MHKILAVLLALLLLCTPALAEEEDDYSMADLIQNMDEVVMEQIVISSVTQEDGTIVEEIVERPVYEEDGSVLITLTCTGDFTIGGDSRKSSSLFDKELKKQGGDINFTMQNVREILLTDDMTLVNFEGTLTESKYVPSAKRENQFLFSAPPAYASILSQNGVEAVSLENNHVMDHGDEAYRDTQEALEKEGIVWSNSTHLGVVEVKGVKIAMLSYLCIDRYASLWDKVPADIRAAKEQYPIVIVSFHWGQEKDYKPRDNQVKMGRLAVDAGADLVIGHHSHRINPIEQYKGVYICYSLGNFCFAGNNKPDDMNSYLFQTRFRVRGDEVSSEGFRIIPISISSSTKYNNFVPTVHTKDVTIDSILNTLKANGKRLEYAVESYPLTWENK